MMVYDDVSLINLIRFDVIKEKSGTILPFPYSFSSPLFLTVCTCYGEPKALSRYSDRHRHVCITNSQFQQVDECRVRISVPPACSCQWAFIVVGDFSLYILHICCMNVNVAA